MKKNLRKNNALIDISSDQFREIGHKLIDDIAGLLSGIGDGRVTSGISPVESKELVGANITLPEKGEDPKQIISRSFETLSKNSLFNGHPKFWGYITASATPIGVLGDLMAAAINPNLGSWKLSPIATEIEAQAVRWIAELIKYPSDCGGIFVSGGNMANFVGFLAARTEMADWDVRKNGLKSDSGRQLAVYASDQAHTWIEKATDIFGLGTDAIRHIKSDSEQRLDVNDLRDRIRRDLDNNFLPMMVVGTAGTVSTGAIDPLYDMASVCKEFGIWFHVDGAYGGFAAALDDISDDIHGLSEADSVAVDPHKWLYSPLEAGCALVRDPEKLRNPFTYHPPYYHFDDETINFVDYGPQNSRGFRALKVWLALKQAGAEGYRQMISEDIELANYMYRILEDNDNFEVFTSNLSIVTFRYIPPELRDKAQDDYLNRLNEALLGRLEKSGELFISNAVIDGRFLLRACIVNFRTKASDVEATPEIIARYGKELDSELRRKTKNPTS